MGGGGGSGRGASTVKLLLLLLLLVDGPIGPVLFESSGSLSNGATDYTTTLLITVLNMVIRTM